MDMIRITGLWKQTEKKQEDKGEDKTNTLF